MPSTKDKPSPCDPKIAASSGQASDRRRESAEQDEKQQLSSGVHFDAKGNPVLEIRAEAPRRRKDDDTIDLLKCLDDESLSLVDEDD